MIRRKKGTGRFMSTKIILDDGTKFDSKLEYERWKFLKSKEEEGLVRNIRTQVKFVLIPAQYILVYRTGKSGKALKPREKMVDRECCYYADFVYEIIDRNSLLPEPTICIEDTKGFRTKEYMIKRKLMRFNGNPIREVKKYNERILL